MKVLVACEFSGRVRDAFLRRGHDAWSCDIIPCVGNQSRHIQGDCVPVLQRPWDLVIAHPPCTYLSKVANAARKKDPIGRRLAMIGAVELFRACLEANAPRIAVENPVIYKEARAMIGQEPTQIIRPYDLGGTDSKGICLWLVGLSSLVPVGARKIGPKNRTGALPGNSYKNKLMRAVTDWHVAEAMAEQWGGLDERGP
jgi:hypothetical protein